MYLLQKENDVKFKNADKSLLISNAPYCVLLEPSPTIWEN